MPSVVFADIHKPEGSALKLLGAKAAHDRDAIDFAVDANFQSLKAAFLKRPPEKRHRYSRLREVKNLDGLIAIEPTYPAEFETESPPYGTGFVFDVEAGGPVFASSGSSGQEKFLYHSWVYNNVVSYLGARGFFCALEKSPAKTVLNCAYFEYLLGSGIFIHQICAILDMRSLPLGPNTSIERVSALIEQHEIDTIVAMPNVLVSLTQAINDTSRAQLRNTVYQSSGMHGNDAALLRSSGFHVRAASYSATETGPIGFQCSDCDDDVYHIHEDAMFVEIVDEENGSAVSIGEAGAVLVTPFSDTGLRLLRYRVGDRARFIDEPCSCGSKFRRLQLLGRADENLNLDGALVTKQLMRGLLAPVLGERGEFQLEVQWLSNGFEILLRVSPDNERRDAELVRNLILRHDRIRMALESDRCLSFRVVFEDHRKFRKTRSGKQLIFIETSDED